MALLDIELLANSETIINANNADSGDTIALKVISGGTLVVDGVDVSLNSVIGVGALSAPTLAVQNGGSLTVSQGLLNANLLSNLKFEIRDEGTLTLDASTLSVGLTETLLNRYDVSYSGAAHTGKFLYKPPLISLAALTNQTFNITGMEATDEFTIQGRTNLRIDAALKGLPPTRNIDEAYRNGVLHLISPAIPLVGEAVKLEIPMSAADFALFKANPSKYLNGTKFVYPGDLVAPCFAAGTMIETEFGLIAVENISSGTRVWTLDHGLQTVRWIGSRKLSAAELSSNESLRPIRIRAGALGENRPSTDLLVSPQHRILIRSNIAQRIFGAEEILVAAKQLLQIDGIDIAEYMAEVHYFHILCDRHEIVLSNGAETETLYTGTEAIKAVGAAAREEIFAIFPELQDDAFTPEPARTLASGRMGRKLAVRHAQNDRVLVS